MGVHLPQHDSLLFEIIEEKEEHLVGSNFELKYTVGLYFAVVRTFNELSIYILGSRESLVSPSKPMFNIPDLIKIIASD